VSVGEIVARKAPLYRSHGSFAAGGCAPGEKVSLMQVILGNGAEEHRGLEIHGPDQDGRHGLVGRLEADVVLFRVVVLDRGLVSDERDDDVAAGQQRFGEPRSDKTGRSGDKDLHSEPLRVNVNASTATFMVLSIGHLHFSGMIGNGNRENTGILVVHMNKIDVVVHLKSYKAKSFPMKQII